jgi:hypothetical protein
MKTIARVRFESPIDSSDFYILNKCVSSLAELRGMIAVAIITRPEYSKVFPPSLFGAPLSK